VAATKLALGADPESSFAVDAELLTRTRAAVAVRAADAKRAWNTRFADWAQRRPHEAALLERLRAGELPSGWSDELPTFDGVSAMATRKASGAVINALATHLPELWGGSADLGESNNTDIKGATSFLPSPDGDPAGRQLHFGIREHAMGSMMNGVALHGRSRIFGGTFLVFSDYMRPAVRMAALMGLPVIYVWTHDSIGLGEDGPTHQPVEHLAALRAIPGLDVIRPADATETAAAWTEVIRRGVRPAGLVLTRQDVPVIDRSSGPAASEVALGGYVLHDAASGAPEVILIASGSEVSLAVAARDSLEAEGIATRVVSMPCIEWFREQSPEYRASVLPPSVRARVSVEAAITWPWAEFIGDAGRSVGLDHFGASADYKRLYSEFGITVDAVVDAAKASRAAASA
jgi:transketolase